jgi:RNA polymerase primary sigma factor
MLAEDVEPSLPAVVAAPRRAIAQKPVAGLPTAKKARAPKSAVVSKPKASSSKGRRDPGRDEMLSEYLSSLGRIPLLTPEEERDCARMLRESELACWSGLLQVREAVEQLEGHLLLLEGTFPAKEALDRLLANGIAGVPHSEEDIAAVSDGLREVDDERHLIDEIITLVSQRRNATDITARPGEAAEARKKRAIETDRAVRGVLDDVVAQRARALRLRNHFVRANLRLVVSVARRFHHYRLPLIDLIQEGNLGLIKSVHRFDHRKGFRFSTYAHWWIRQAIERAIMNKGAQVRLPVHIFDARREVAKAGHDLQQSLGREANHAELAKALNMQPEKLEEILRAVPREPTSLDDPLGDDEDRTLGEVIADQDAAAPDERVIQVNEAKFVRKLLGKLSPMEMDIIRRRFGLGTDDDETLEEIGKSYNLSRERVRQIQVQGLKKMAGYCAVANS